MFDWTTRSVLVFLLAVACSAGLAEDKQTGKPNAQPGLASVKVEQLEPLPIGTNWKWNKLPEFLTDAQIYEKVKGQPQPKLQFEVQQDGVLLLAASWTYDGNPSGGWIEKRWTEKMLVDAGWIPIGEIVRINKDQKPDPHVVFRKVVKAGEKLELHTRKYNAPLLILPAANRVQDVLAAKTVNVAPLASASPRSASRAAKILDYQDQLAEQGVLVGFRVTIDAYEKRRKLGSVQAIYETPQGRMPGKVQGEVMGFAVEVQAKPGYAVGGLTLSTGDSLAGFNVTFVRRTAAGLDPRETYRSRWIGDQTGAAEVRVDVSEQPFVGIRGKLGDAIQTIELISAKPLP